MARNSATSHLVRRLTFIARFNNAKVWPVLAGGSTIVVLFEKGVVQWDEDLLINGRASLETLVRVGMGVGRKPNA